ncbi:MAG TPA: cobyrinate a,c-diamide synthase, partial [Chloroflexota bacterium]|nr:cobyrinate a,c-diamide synthase [Chloroflexota bacterium]
MFEIPRIVIAGAASGVGKTIITAGLAKALTRRGLHVATFKAGPDFIDPSFLSLASGRPSHNLDTWMLSKDALLEIFTRGSAGSDVAIIEGMMGLYDGRGPVSEDGSTAQLARALRAPVVLVVDAGRASRSIAALVEGYRRFDRRIALAGVVGNQLASKRHAEWVRQAIESHSPIAVLGSLERSSDMVIPSRHLGLVQAGDVSGAESTIDRAADIAESYLDLDAILGIARAAPAIRTKSQPAAREGADRVRIGVARDAAF